MGEEMEIHVPESKQSGKKSAAKPRKRKRDVEEMSPDAREAKIELLKKELDGLFEYFSEVSGKDWSFMEESGNLASPINSVIACLLEESDLPFSKLVQKIHEKVKTREGVSLVSVRSTVLFVGQRSMYGIANADADVLEDSSQKCLWCWETRDLKLVPKTQRGLLNIRRTCRRTIQDRISTVSAMIAALQVYSHQDHKADLMKTSDKLMKVLNEAEIRLMKTSDKLMKVLNEAEIRRMKTSDKLMKVLNEAEIRHLMENMVQKSDTELAEKDAKLKEKELVNDTFASTSRFPRTSRPSATPFGSFTTYPISDSASAPTAPTPPFGVCTSVPSRSVALHTVPSTEHIHTGSELPSLGPDSIPPPRSYDFGQFSIDPVARERFAYLGQLLDETREEIAHLRRSTDTRLLVCDSRLESLEARYIHHEQLVQQLIQVSDRQRHTIDRLITLYEMTTLCRVPPSDIHIMSTPHVPQRALFPPLSTTDHQPGVSLATAWVRPNYHRST